MRSAHPRKKAVIFFSTSWSTRGQPFCAARALTASVASSVVTPLLSRPASTLLDHQPHNARTQSWTVTHLPYSVCAGYAVSGRSLAVLKQASVAHGGADLLLHDLLQELFQLLCGQVPAAEKASRSQRLHISPSQSSAVQSSTVDGGRTAVAGWASRKPTPAPPSRQEVGRCVLNSVHQTRRSSARKRESCSAP